VAQQVRRRLVPVLTATAMSLAAVVTTAGPARAVTPTYSLALGDSLAFGTGAAPGAGYVPVNVAQACNLTHMCVINDFHANDAGHALLATTIEAVLAQLKA